ncbi:MAG TPA: stage II sporulation protein M, partial [Gemmatimonadales bacterium]|nr:stage II sporulation protein M [Gemmatimonadales bacterium]
MSTAARGPAPLDLRERHGIETPEHVDVHLELAGVGSRAAAAVLDTALVFVIVLVLAIAAAELTAGTRLGEGPPWISPAMMVLLYLAYFVLFEGLNGGRTPGKQALGIRVVMDTGRAVTFTAAVVRNLVRLVDCLAFAGVPALLSAFLNKSHKRPGDFAAGTVVVRDRPTERLLQALPEVGEPELVEAGPPELTEDEFRLLDRFLARLPDLDPEVQVRMAGELARRFEERVPRRTTDTYAYLTELFGEEQRKRRSRFGTRAQAGAAGRTIVTAERFVARKRAQWEAFHAAATRVERTGVGGLPPGEIPAFAARYREIAADLARARTYGVDPRVVEYLERLVAAGHNALYRSRGRARLPLGRYLLQDFPAAVVQSWRYVVAAFLLTVVPAGVGYVMLRQQPALADELASPVMVSRAEQAAQETAEGRGYAQAPSEERPQIAAFIITNNILVCFQAFAGGITAGLFTALVLLFNGLMLGTAYGVFANYHASLYLTTFIAPHGVLELTAI